MKLFFSLLLFFVTTYTFSQEHRHNKAIDLIETAFKNGVIDYEESLLQKFYYGFNSPKLSSDFSIPKSEQTKIKCATHLIDEFYDNKALLTQEAIDEIYSLLNRPFQKSVTAATFISPSGKFELTYETSGTHAVNPTDGNSNSVPDFVEWVADYFDYSWRFTIDTLGHAAPPIGTGRYQIGFENMEFYGYCQSIGGRLTRIVMHHTFVGFPPNNDPEGRIKGAAKVTAIHEFKHAVQMAFSGWNEPGWFLEMDATWMEDIGYNVVNDYYNYLNSSQIVSPQRNFAQGRGYEDCIWLHYVSQKHGVNTNRLLWERRRSVPGENIYTTFNSILSTFGSTFQIGFAEYHTWNYFTNLRSTPLFRSYIEAANYPISTECKNVVIPDSSGGCNVTTPAANFIYLRGANLNNLISLFFDNRINSPGIVQLAIKYKNNTSEILSFNISQLTSVERFFTRRISEIDYIVLIPVFTSTTAVSGNFSYRMTPFFPITFAHTPQRDVTANTPIEIKLQIQTPQNIIVRDSLKIHYRIGTGNFNSFRMTPTLIPNEFSFTINNIPLNSRINYFFSVYDTLRNYHYFPSDAPTSIFAFFVGPDTTRPTISFSYSNKVSQFQFPITLFARVADNMALDSVFVEYRLNNTTLTKQNLIRYRDDIYYVKLPYESQNVNVSDRIHYRFTAIDNSPSRNRTSVPQSGFNSLDVEKAFVFQNNPNRTVPDLAPLGLRDTIVVPFDLNINDVNLYLEINHARASDLNARMITPYNPNLAILFERFGLSTRFSNAVNPKLFFNRNAFFNISQIELLDSTKAEGEFQPDTARVNFNSFVNQNAKGNWVINILDRNSGVVGTLSRWALIIFGDSISTSVKDDFVDLNTFSLSQNYPNPFNPSTLINWNQPFDGFVSLKVYDILGNEIATLVNQERKSGSYKVEFDATNLTSGIYFYRIIVNQTGGGKAGKFSETKKMILMQ